jgi:hypothetical protein
VHIKFLEQGSGSGESAANYLLQDRDHTGENRAGIDVLLGNPHAVAAVADSLDFKRKYSSAVISWAPTDRPTPEEIKEVVSDFEKMARAGLGDRVPLAVVQHDEPGGGVHVHILIARVDLETGKTYNPAPPGWQRSFDPIRDYHNAQHDWARPDDPDRARMIAPAGHKLKNKDARQAKNDLSLYIKDAVDNGLASNRADVISALAEFGEITRAGKNYISVKPPGFEKPIRLKGGYFNEQFSVGTEGTLTVEEDRESGNGAADRSRRAAEALKKIETAISSRTAYNFERYQVRKSSVAAVPEPDPDPVDRLGPDPRPRPGSDHGSGVLETGGEHRKKTGSTFDSQRRDGRQLRPGVSAARSIPRRVSKLKWAMGILIKLKSEIEHLIMNSNTELEQFKTEIDLSIFLEQQGYQKDNFASCRSSAVYRSGPDEKLIIGRRGDHFVYTNTKNPSDAGSIIDFVQKRTGKSLGQVRQALRPVLGGGEYLPQQDWAEPAESVEKSQWTWANTGRVFDPRYLQDRGIDIETIEKYRERIHQTRRGNFLFGHYGPQGFSGFEIKSPDGTGRFAAGCEKTFFSCLTDQKLVKRLVVTETAIDALSYAQMDGLRDDTAYLSLAGNPSPEQLEQLRALAGMDNILSIVLAHDNDQGGDRQAEKCRQALVGVDVRIDRHAPADAGADWNQVLQDQQQKLGYGGPKM